MFICRALKKFNVETGRGSNKIGKAKFLSVSTIILNFEYIVIVDIYCLFI